jgi:replicative DNA helicase
MAEKRQKAGNAGMQRVPGDLDIGKLPPQAVELEEAVLGAIMLEKDAILGVLDLLTPESFYKDEHQKIYAAIQELASEQKPVDILTVKEELKKREELDLVGGAYYLSQLTSRVISAAHVEYHARIVAQKYIQRELIRVSSEIQKRSFDETVDVDDLLNFSEQELFQIAEGYIKKETLKINTLVHKAIEQIQEAGKREDNLSGVPSGFTKLDRLTSGWQPSDLVIIAARPSMGKTAFALSMARNIAIDHERPVAIFSLEMSSLQLVNRLIVSETELPVSKVRNGKLTDEEWKHLEANIKELIDAPIYIDDTPAISLFEFRAKCRRLKMQYDVQVIIVDYLQLMSAPGDSRGNREQEVSSISRTLKTVAKELDVPIIALSQLNRSVELRSGNKRPQLSDLRESGAIEQDADMVLFIHRPEKYNIHEDEEGRSTKGVAEIILAKHRNGPIGDIKLRFKEEQAKFTDLEDWEETIDQETMTVTLGSKMNEEGAVTEHDFFRKDAPSGSQETPF